MMHSLNVGAFKYHEKIKDVMICAYLLGCEKN